MAERVVDHLEAVEVEDEHGDGAAVARGERERVVDAVDEQRAVRQPGQGVVQRAVLGLLLERDDAPQRVVEAGRVGDGAVLSRGREHGGLGVELVHLGAERGDDHRVELATGQRQSSSKAVAAGSASR